MTLCTSHLSLSTRALTLQSATSHICGRCPPKERLHPHYALLSTTRTCSSRCCRSSHISGRFYRSYICIPKVHESVPYLLFTNFNMPKKEYLLITYHRVPILDQAEVVGSDPHNKSSHYRDNRICITTSWAL